MPGVYAGGELLMGDSERATRMFWVVGDNGMPVHATGYECAGQHYWWFPEVGCSIPEAQCHGTAAAAARASILKLEADRRAIDDKLARIRAGNREFDAAAHLLRAPIIGHRTARFIDEAHQSIEFMELLKHSAPWSHGERILVDVALDLWNGLTRAYVLDEAPLGTEAISLGEILSTLDDGNLTLVLEAARIRRWGHA